MAFSGKVSSSPIKRLPSLHPRISFLYFHLYQFWFTSENDPLRPINFNHFFPIPPRDNWSKLESGIFAWTRPDKPFFFPNQPSLRVLNVFACGHKPGGLEDLRGAKVSLTSHEIFNWALKLRCFFFPFKEGKTASKVERIPLVSKADQPVSGSFSPSSVLTFWFSDLSFACNNKYSKMVYFQINYDTQEWCLTSGGKQIPHLQALKTYYSNQLVIPSSRILQEREIFSAKVTTVFK